MAHPIEDLLKNTMESLKSIIDVDTIIGNPITAPENTTIIPVSKVSLGFASAGSEFTTEKPCKNTTENDYPFGGGSGGGLSVKPVAFLIIQDGSYRILPLGEENTVNKLIDSIPQVIDLLKQKNKCEPKDDSSNCSKC